MQEPPQERIVIGRVPLPVVVSLQSDVDESVDALAAIITDCSAYKAGNISFLDLLQSVIAFSQVVEAGKGGLGASHYPIVP